MAKYNPYDDNEDPFSAVRDEEGRIASMGSTSKPDIERDKREAATSGPLKQTFKQAFANAEKGSTFTWNGKKYKKEYASDKPKAKPQGSGKPVSTAGSIAQKNAEQLSRMGKSISDTLGAKVERKKPVSTAGAIASANMKKGGQVSSASKRADGIATRGKTRCRIV